MFGARPESCEGGDTLGWHDSMGVSDCAQAFLEGPPDVGRRNGMLRRHCPNIVSVARAVIAGARLSARPSIACARRTYCRKREAPGPDQCVESAESGLSRFGMIGRRPVPRT